MSRSVYSPSWYAIAAALVPAVFGGGETAAPSDFSPGLALIDAGTGKQIASIPRSQVALPCGAGYSEGHFWVVNCAPRVLVEIGPETGADNDPVLAAPRWRRRVGDRRADDLGRAGPGVGGNQGRHPVRPDARPREPRRARGGWPRWPRLGAWDGAGRRFPLGRERRRLGRGGSPRFRDPPGSARLQESWRRLHQRRLWRRSGLDSRRRRDATHRPADEHRHADSSYPVCGALRQVGGSDGRATHRKESSTRSTRAGAWWLRTTRVSVRTRCRSATGRSGFPTRTSGP